MRIFYNSRLSFNRRIYEALDVALRPIHLPQPLEDFMKQPGLYTRGPTPHACFQSLTRFPKQLLKRGSSCGINPTSSKCHLLVSCVG